MKPDRRLEWVIRNKTRPERVRSMGRAVERAVQAVVGEDHAVLTAIADALSPLVDAKFREHCKVAAVRDCRLVIEVNPPGLEFAMRNRWNGTIERALRELGRGYGVRTAVFKSGVGGVRVPEPGDKLDTPGSG